LRVERLRARLDEYVFLEAPPPPPFSVQRLLVGSFVFIGLIAVQLARMWPSLPLNTIWAEDGTAWLTYALHHDLVQAITTPHAGYLQTVSRLVAQPVSSLSPIRFAPAMSLSGAAIVAVCSIVVWRASAAHIRSRYLRLTLASMLVLVPTAGAEMLDNTVNTIWFLTVVSFWILLWRPASFVRAVAAATLLLLAGLSSIGIAFLLPVALLRAVAARDRRDAIIVAAFALGAGAQLYVASSQSTGMAHWDWGLIPAYTQRVVGGALTGLTITGELWKQFGVGFEIALGAVLVGLLLFGVIRLPMPARLLGPLAIAISFATFVISGYERAVGSTLLWPHGSYHSGVSRYVVVPTLVLLSGIILMLDASPCRSTVVTWRRLRIGVTLLVLVGAASSFDASDASRGPPTWSYQVAKARTLCHYAHARVAPMVADPIWLPPFYVPCNRFG
jgi:hypothetical protein